MLAVQATARAESPAPDAFRAVEIPAWVHGVTRMAFVTPGELDQAADMGAQVVHFNLVWPYYPLRRDGGGLKPDEARELRQFVERCHSRGIRAVLGLPPFPPVELVREHPDWRVHPDPSDAASRLEPQADDLSTRICCNNGPWGEYLIEICAELVEDYDLDGYSFDGNYHAAICYCPVCRDTYRADRQRDLPPGVSLDDVSYREYLVWRGERLEDHYRRLQARIKGIDPDAVLMSWTVNAGRYGHFLYSPRAMPTRLNLLLDLPMQEWWLDETNFGASVAPSFGAAYLRATVGGRPCASEPYLMSRGNPYGTDSFPRHERVARALLAATYGSAAADALGWPGHRESTADVFTAIAVRERWLTRTRDVPWAAMLASEQTRQFYAYGDIAGRHLPHVFGTFRAALEEHLPLAIVNDWDLTSESLSQYRVLVLPGAAALSDEQVAAVRQHVRGGGGLVATCETSLCDELGRPRGDFALADVFGVSYRGRMQAPIERAELDANFAVHLDESYWRDRSGLAQLSWDEHPLVADERLQELVPTRRVTFRGPQALVSEPAGPDEVALRLHPEGWAGEPPPGAIVRQFGAGRVVYFPAGIDFGLWSYSYPYQRRLLARAIELAAGGPPPIAVEAPMCVHATVYEQHDADGRRLVLHLFNGLNSAAGHGLPAAEVPLREESLPIHGIRVRLAGFDVERLHVEPGGATPEATRIAGAVSVTLPPLDLHAMLVAELREAAAGE